MLRVHHLGGPLEGADISLTSRRTPHRLIYAPMAPPERSLAAGYILVGFNDDSDEWTGAVSYILDREASSLEPHERYGDDGMEQGTAVYRLVA